MPTYEFIRGAVILFGAALCVTWLFRFLRAPAIIGFLVTGITIGSSGLRLIPADAVSLFLDLGLVMLMFSVGLELSAEPLLRSGRRLAIAGVLQIVCTAVVAIAIMRHQVSMPWAAVLLIGIAVTNSSTAIILKQLSDRGQTDSVVGVLTTGVVLMQDLAVIVTMIILPLAASGAEASWTSTVIRAAVSLTGLVVVVAAARKMLPWIVRQVIQRGGREFITLFSVFMACAGAWLAGLAGWSAALGAFIAGLLLSRADIRHQFLAEIIPFRDVFNALFFISIGMLVRFDVVMDHAGTLAIAVGATMALKTLLTAGPLMIVGWPMRMGLHVGLGLCTVSEFAYMLLREANKRGLVADEVLDGIIGYAVVTMLVGTLLIPVAGPVAGWTARFLRAREPSDEGDAPSSLSQHVIIVGFGLNGQNLARVLGETKITHCVVEMNPGLVRTASGSGCPVIIGDATRLEILRRAGIESARAMVVAINDLQATRWIVGQARAARPDLYILARTRYVTEIEPLYRLGAQQVIPEEFETSIEIFAHVLKELRIPDNVIEAQVAMIRAGRYGMLRGGLAARQPVRDLMHYLEATATQTVVLTEDSPARGKTIRELDLRARSGATIIAVVRQGKPTTNPPPDWLLQPGDVLVLVGTHAQLDSAEALYTAVAQETG